MGLVECTESSVHLGIVKESLILPQICMVK